MKKREEEQRIWWIVLVIVLSLFVVLMCCVCWFLILAKKKREEKPGNLFIAHGIRPFHTNYWFSSTSFVCCSCFWRDPDRHRKILPWWIFTGNILKSILKIGWNILENHPGRRSNSDSSIPYISLWKFIRRQQMPVLIQILDPEEKCIDPEQFPLEEFPLGIIGVCIVVEHV